MPNYKPDPNDSTKQVPGDFSDQHFDRHQNPAMHSMSKTPHYIIVSDTPDNDIGFFFGNSSSFATLSTSEGTVAHLTGSQHYANFGKPTAGTTLNINPLAWSGSAADAGKVIFIYKGGLDGLGRP